MTREEFMKYQNQLINTIKANQIETAKMFEKVEKQRQADKIELQNQFTNMLKAYREETAQMFEKVEKQRQKDKAEAERQRLADKLEFEEKLNKMEQKWDQKFDSLTSLIKNNHVEITNRLDKIEADVEMLKSFHKEDILNYKNIK
ncbi:hypothetical protein QLQ80_00720 [Mycoplasma sp. M5725]|uniref:Uncharacterized protein n=1 Tax=Mycoplasma phocimorsus TaxID=3045839 RepID=A0AAJ1UVK8_9MOLU|nr:hypothetical protein [Mycoplasma phocimorsus]MDJ1645614.1 hypothetical protein [Mycoplasma phocimorsus]